MRLGKQEYEYDEKTLKLALAISPTVVIPHMFDLDKGRAVFPLALWGNDRWGNCVKVAEANEIIRLERLEQRRTLAITEQLVVDAYKAQTGALMPGDANDHGLVMLQNLREWRKTGFVVKSRTYDIAAFGELDPHDSQMLRAAVFLLHGVQFGFALPKAAQNMGDVWDYRDGTSGDWRPGSWGGHAVFSKRYDEGGMEVLTWGKRVYVTNAFIERYADEAWAVVDNFDHWRKRPEIDINAIIQHLRDIGASGIQ
jgi:hypothetical protein